MSYFQSHADAERPGRVRTINRQLRDETKLYLLFLNYLLPTVNVFNMVFQATNYTTIHLLHAEIVKLTKRIIRGFVKIECIDRADVTVTPYADSDKQVNDDDLEIGQDARVLAVTMVEDVYDREVQAFYGHVRSFYEVFVHTIIKKFPFKSTLLSDLKVLQPTGDSHLQRLPQCCSTPC